MSDSSLLVSPLPVSFCSSSPVHPEAQVAQVRLSALLGQAEREANLRHLLPSEGHSTESVASTPFFACFRGEAGEKGRKERRMVSKCARMKIVPNFFLFVCFMFFFSPFSSFPCAFPPCASRPPFSPFALPSLRSLPPSRDGSEPQEPRGGFQGRVRARRRTSRGRIRRRRRRGRGRGAACAALGTRGSEAPRGATRGCSDAIEMGHAVERSGRERGRGCRTETESLGQSKTSRDASLAASINELCSCSCCRCRQQSCSGSRIGWHFSG